MTNDENSFLEARGLGPAAAGYTFTDQRFSLARAAAHKNLDLNGGDQYTQLPPNNLLLMRFQSRKFAGGASIDEHDHEPHIHFNELTANHARDLGLIP